MKEFLKPDKWLGDIIGCPAYALQASSEDMLSWSHTPPVLPAACFVTAKLPTDAIMPLDVLLRAGFRLIETNIILEKTPNAPVTSSSPPSVEIRHARPTDAPGVRELARTGFRYSRFHLDNRLDPATANEIKAQWVGNFFTGRRGDSLWVALDGIQVAGFLLMTLGSEEAAIIDLIAVDSRYQRRGVARSLLRQAECHYRQKRLLRVGTQIVNHPSLRLYENEGFRIQQSQYVLHFHTK